MPDFRTPVNISPAGFQIGHKQPILLSGSCFTAHIGAHLQQRLFNVMVNPFGIIYNPVALAKSIDGSAQFAATDFFEQEGRWRHWDLHSELAHTDLDTAVQLANEAVQQVHTFLEKAGVLVFTLGTSQVFTLQSTGAIVANCHKMPAAMFGRRRLTVEETTAAIAGAVQAARKVNPEIKVVLTVSPVRHLREGAIENQRSKAVLLLACEAVSNTIDDVYYFPAYELLLDDLRDYRFYDSDMIHPSTIAVGYIWEHFAQTFFSQETIALNTRIEKINAALQHRPFNPDSPQHQAFVQKQQALMAELKNEHPHLAFGL